jgi:hypothetical protein
VGGGIQLESGIHVDSYLPWQGGAPYYMTKTKSELLFEQLCSEHDVRCEPVSRGPIRTPDYDVYFGAQQVVVEVKQVEPTADEAKEIARWEAGEVITFGGEAGKRVRQEVTDSKKQLRARAKGRFPALLVLYNNAEPISFLDPMFVLVAMYGALTLPIFTPKDGGTPFGGRLRFGGKRRVTKEHNTTLSAVCVLVLNPEDKTTLTFYHNYFAALSFDPQWFQGERVRHYRLPQAEAESGNYGFWVDLDGKHA